jgi:hypothetical protein
MCRGKTASFDDVRIEVPISGGTVPKRLPLTFLQKSRKYSFKKTLPLPSTTFVSNHPFLLPNVHSSAITCAVMVIQNCCGFLFYIFYRSQTSTQTDIGCTGTPFLVSNI